MAQRHRTVREIWYFLQGRGQVWRERADTEQVADVGSGHCLIIEVGTHFQFRNMGTETLTFIIATVPTWPGQEAVAVGGLWEPAR